MSEIKHRVQVLIDGIVHNGGVGQLACGMIVFDRSMDAIVNMFVEAVGKDVDCMACLVAEARHGEES